MILQVEGGIVTPYEHMLPVSATQVPQSCFIELRRHPGYGSTELPGLGIGHMWLTEVDQNSDEAWPVILTRKSNDWSESETL
jgi:hypothetical protein